MIMDLLLKEIARNLMLQRELEGKLEKLPKDCIKERKIRNNTYYYLAYTGDYSWMKIYYFMFKAEHILPKTRYVIKECLE